MIGIIRDHGGGVDAASRKFGGARSDWIDLSTGINPLAYPLPVFETSDWTDLPDQNAQSALIRAARHFWAVPETADVLATCGASVPISTIPRLVSTGRVQILPPTYNEHAAAFRAAGWDVTEARDGCTAQVLVHPNNPDGRRFDAADLHAPMRIIDESFCDVAPDASLMAQATRPGTLILKSLGKFWGLAGARLGFVIGDPQLVAALSEMLGPWPVPGPTLRIGTAALSDPVWADETRVRLQTDAARLDSVLMNAKATPLGGTTLFRLYEVEDAVAWQTRLAHHRIWSRIFPYNSRWLRLGLPPAHGWDRLQRALA